MSSQITIKKRRSFSAIPDDILEDSRMRPETRLVLGWLTLEEKQEVTALARQVHITTSELVRRLVTGRKLPNAARHEAVIALVKINADLARLGNLFRMALDDPDFNPPYGMNLETLFDNIRTTQDVLKSKVKEL
jgi:hypothetical protein